VSAININLFYVLNVVLFFEFVDLFVCLFAEFVLSTSEIGLSSPRDKRNLRFCTRHILWSILMGQTLLRPMNVDLGKTHLSTFRVSCTFSQVLYHAYIIFVPFFRKQLIPLTRCHTEGCIFFYPSKWKHELDTTILSILFHLILLSTCFGCYTHPSTGASNMYNPVWYNLITVIAMGVHFELDKYIIYHWLNIW